MKDQKVLEKLYAYIDAHQDDIISDLMNVSAIKSVSEPESDVKPFGQGVKDAMACMFKKGEAMGFATHDYEGYVGSIKYDAGNEESIGIWAHLDVVPEGEGWLSDPYKPIIRDGLLFGRGCSDDKSGAVGGLYIAKALQENNVALRHNIEVMLGTNEEKEMADVEYFCSHYKSPKFSFVADAGFPGSAGEFGRLAHRVESKQKLSDDFVDMYAGNAANIIPNKAVAILKKDTAIKYQTLDENYIIEEVAEGIKITALGVAGHAAGPERANNAVKVLTNGLLKLDGLKASDKAIIEFLDNVNWDYYGTYLGFAKTDDISGQTVSSGTVLRYDHGHVKLTSDCRFCVTDTLDRILPAIVSKAKEHDFEVVVEESSKPYHLDPNGPTVKIIKQVYADWTKEEKEIHIGKGGTYAGKIPNAFATGICLRDWMAPKPDYLEAGHGGAHQPDEFLDIAGYIEGIKLLMTMVLAVDEVL